MTTPTPQAIERAARAIMIARNNDECLVKDWDQEAIDNPHVARAMRQAKAALTADLGDMVLVPRSDYQRLLFAAENDDMIVWCETCGAWLDRDDPVTATTDDYTGCWKIAAGEDNERCRSGRAMIAAAGEK